MGCRPLARITSAGQRHDSLAFAPLMDQLKIARRGPGRPGPGPAGCWAITRVSAPVLGPLDQLISMPSWHPDQQRPGRRGGRYSGHPADLLVARSCGQRPVKPLPCPFVIIWTDSNPVFATCYARCTTWMTTVQASPSLYTDPIRTPLWEPQTDEAAGHSSAQSSTAKVEVAVRKSAIRPTPAARSAPTCADAASKPPFPSHLTRYATGCGAAAAAAAHPPSTPPPTRTATPSSARSASSASTAPSPPDSINATSPGAAPSTSPPSGSGFATPSMIYRTRPKRPQLNRAVIPPTRRRDVGHTPQLEL